MRQKINSLLEKTSLGMIILVFSIFLVAGGIVYATWDTAKTTDNVGANAGKVIRSDWDDLVNQVGTTCGGACFGAITTNARSSTVGAGCTNGCITMSAWNGFVNLFKQALPDNATCLCQHSPCGNWSDAESSANFSKSNWNALVEEIYGKCSNASCLTKANAAKISGTKLTTTNWDNLVDLANMTVGHCSTCVGTCASTPGCLASAPAHSQSAAGTCCGGNSCYSCAAGYTWDGSACSLESIDPTVGAFTAVATGGNVAISYTVNDTGGSYLDKVEVWRTTDSAGSPNAAGWMEVAALRKTVAGSLNSYSDTVTDSPGVGTWWYGIHVVDKAANMGQEASPIKVTTTAGAACVGGKSYMGVCWRVSAPGTNCNTTCSTHGSCQAIAVTTTQAVNVINLYWPRIPTTSGVYTQGGPASIFGFNCLTFTPSTNAQYQGGGYAAYPCAVDGCPSCGFAGCYLNVCPCAN